MMNSNVIRIGTIDFPEEDPAPAMPVEKGFVGKFLEFIATSVLIIVAIMIVLVLGVFWIVIFISPDGILIMGLIATLFFAFALGGCAK